MHGLLATIVFGGRDGSWWYWGLACSCHNYSDAIIFLPNSLKKKAAASFFYCYVPVHVHMWLIKMPAIIIIGAPSPGILATTVVHEPSGRDGYGSTMIMVNCRDLFWWGSK